MKKPLPIMATINRLKIDQLWEASSRIQRLGLVLEVDILKNDAYLMKNGDAF
ncbi:MAG: hypothetical protein ACKPB3_11285 [Bacteroidota bacterium]